LLRKTASLGALSILAPFLLLPTPAPGAGEIGDPQAWERYIEESVNEGQYPWVGTQGDTTPGFSFLDEFLRWVDQLFQSNPEKESPVPDEPAPSEESFVDPAFLRVLAILLLAVVILLVVYSFWRSRQELDPTGNDEGLDIPPARPDPNDANVSASRLPSEEWILLGDDLVRTGENRAAMRAFFLAGLARLAEGGQLLLRENRTNLEYERELRRRGDTSEQTRHTFERARRLLEKHWYGYARAGQPEAVRMRTHITEELLP